MKSLDEWNTTSKATIIAYCCSYSNMNIVVLCVQAQNTTSVLLGKCVIWYLKLLKFDNFLVTRVVCEQAHLRENSQFSRKWACSQAITRANALAIGEFNERRLYNKTTLLLPYISTFKSSIAKVYHACM